MTRQAECSIEDLMAKRGLTEEDLKPYREALEERIRVYRLQEARKMKGLTQSQVAERMGVSQKRVCEIEQGDIAHAQLSTLQRYVEALGGVLHVTAKLPHSTEPLVIA